jgi:hypothetical protein
MALCLVTQILYCIEINFLSKAVCLGVGLERNEAELMMFGLHVKVFPNGYFERDIDSAVCLARPTQTQKALI